MTYQVGTENMVDPYIDDALVSLSELRDAQFSDLTKFSCGSNFVIGESQIAGCVVDDTDDSDGNSLSSITLKKVDAGETN